MFAFSKIIGNLIEPATFLVFLAVLGLVCRAFRAPFVQRLGRILIGFVLIVVLLLSFLPIGKWALLPLENRYAQVELPPKVDGIILLTGDEAPALLETRGIAVAGWASQRYIHLARLAQKYPDAKLVVTGDTLPATQNVTQRTTQDVSSDILKTIGVPLSRVIFERDSRNTRENAANTKRLLNPESGEIWVIVSMAAHLPRAVLCFAQEGWDVIPSPSDYYTRGDEGFSLYTHLTDNLRYLSSATHEYYGLVAYWLLGWTDRLWR